MKKHIFKLLGIMILLFAGSNLMANNITAGNGLLNGKNTTNKYIMVQFNLSWDNIIPPVFCTTG